MRALLQRVSSASVTVEGETVGSIGHGLVILVGVGSGDEKDDATFLAERCSVLRIFSDDDGKMNLSVKDVGGKVLVVSQFTLYGDTRKGTRPSYSDAADPRTAEELYEVFCGHLRGVLGDDKVRTGVFAAMMKVELVNEGPSRSWSRAEPRTPAGHEGFPALHGWRRSGRQRSRRESAVQGVVADLQKDLWG